MARRGAGTTRRGMHGARRRGATGIAMAALGLACAAVATAGTATGAPRLAAGRSGSPMATIEIVDFAFAPADLTVDAGTTVIWTNTGENDHTVTGDDGSFLSKRLAPGDAYRHTFRAAGRFAYHCSLHESMEARIVVRGGGATSTTAASTTSSTPSTTAPSTTTPSSAPSTTITTVVTPDDLAKTGIGSPTTWLLLVGIALALGGVYVVWTRGPRPVMAQTRSSLPSRKELPEDLHARRRDERHGRD